MGGARVLDIAITDVKRAVNQIKLSPPVLSDDGGSADIAFDFLDYGDGALVRILTAGEAAKVTVRGDVIGMPKGIVCTEPATSLSISFDVGFTLWAIAEVAMVGVAAFIYHEVTGSWSDAWLMGIPIFLALIPLFGALLIDESGTRLRRRSAQRQRYPEFKFPSEFPYGRFIFDFPIAASAPSIEVEEPRHKSQGDGR